jgi:hypothetical protein
MIAVPGAGVGPKTTAGQRVVMLAPMVVVTVISRHQHLHQELFRAFGLGWSPSTTGFTSPDGTALRPHCANLRRDVRSRTCHHVSSRTEHF